MPIRLIADGAFASAELAWIALKLNIGLISRLRLDARIFDFPEEKSGPGRPAKRRRRLLAPKTLLTSVLGSLPSESRGIFDEISLFCQQAISEWLYACWQKGEISRKDP
jgi:hypothetical protein